MRAGFLSALLVVLALVGCASVSGVEIDQYAEGALVAPLEAFQLGEAQEPEADGEDKPDEAASDDSESEGDDKPPAGSDAIDDLKKDVDSATDEDQVKASMGSTVQKAMAEKKADLLTKASKAADEKTEKAAAKRAEKKAKQDIDEEEAKAQESAEARDADAKAAKKKLEATEMEMNQATDEVSQTGERKKLLFKRQSAEEEAKTATAERISAEEKAKISAAQRVAAEEDAKKAAAMRLTQEEQARASQKSPLELHAMEAKAFQQAAELKIREGEALARVAALKSGSDLKHTEDVDVAKEATEKGALHEAKVRLHHLVEQATAALFDAKAKPFDKKALQEVIHMKERVSEAKADVLRLAGSVKTVQVDVAHDEKMLKHSDDPSVEEEKHGDHDDKFDDSKDDQFNSEHDVDEKHEKHYDLKHPDIRHMSEEQIKYWANKKMKWRIEDPMDKNKVMAKIFQVKNMEAETLEKMNELNTQVEMNSTGVRAGLMAKGETVIMNGELVKPDPKFHIKHTFQGQKGRDPATEDNGRDPENDALKKLTDEDLRDHVKSMHEDTEDEIKIAVDARTAPYAPEGSPDAAARQLSALKKNVMFNRNVRGLGPKEDPFKKAKESDTEEDSETASGVDADAKDEDDDEDPSKAPDPTLGETDEDSDDDQVDAIMEKADDDAMSDENDVDETMDETSMQYDLDTVDDDEPGR